MTYNTPMILTQTGHTYDPHSDRTHLMDEVQHPYDPHSDRTHLMDDIQHPYDPHSDRTHLMDDPYRHHTQTEINPINMTYSETLNTQIIIDTSRN
jgi:hypothetical protein